jgi:hypothetical protein
MSRVTDGVRALSALATSGEAVSYPFAAASSRTRVSVSGMDRNGE